MDQITKQCNAIKLPHTEQEQKLKPPMLPRPPLHSCPSQKYLPIHTIVALKSHDHSNGTRLLSKTECVHRCLSTSLHEVKITKVKFFLEDNLCEIYTGTSFQNQWVTKAFLNFIETDLLFCKYFLTFTMDLCSFMYSLELTKMSTLTWQAKIG